MWYKNVSSAVLYGENEFSDPLIDIEKLLKITNKNHKIKKKKNS